MMEKATFIEIKELETRSPKEQVQIKKNIIRSNDLYSIPTIYLPDIITNEYYFVSYSHKDYVDVYCDIFDLQMEGLPIWYDRGIPVGKNWKEVATRFIAPYACKGTLFYVSENSLTSDAVMEEIKSVKGYNKPFMAILISKEKESLRELIERIYKENKISEKKYKFLLNIFKDEIIYLDIGTPTSTKVEKIKNSLPDQPH
ncbi:MAG: toll/interleukin-1 receptor domain-containing protein [Bacilli bacterium]|nr:toll/interleukin-1 receptor domain-containing protein [Bacilli bacterium]